MQPVISNYCIRKLHDGIAPIYLIIKCSYLYGKQFYSDRALHNMTAVTGSACLTHSEGSHYSYNSTRPHPNFTGNLQVTTLTIQLVPIPTLQGNILQGLSTKLKIIHSLKMTLQGLSTKLKTIDHIKMTLQGLSTKLKTINSCKKRLITNVHYRSF